MRTPNQSPMEEGRVSRTVAAAAGVVTLGALLFAAGSSPQSTFPVHIDEPVTSAGVVEGAQILDSFLTTIAAPGQGTATVIVPLDEVAARCGDGDGCLLRLYQTSDSISTLASAYALHRFSTSSSGTTWRNFLIADSESWSFGGSTTDATTEVIYKLDAGDRECELRDEGTTQNYRLRAENVTPGPNFTCVLRIED